MRADDEFKAAINDKVLVAEWTDGIKGFELLPWIVGLGAEEMRENMLEIRVRNTGGVGAVMFAIEAR